MNDVFSTLNNNQGVISVIIFILSIIFAWAVGLLKWLKTEISKNRKSKRIICAWRTYDSSTNHTDYLEYKFGPIFQNKNDEVIRDFWINFSSSGFDMLSEQKPQMVLFDGWNIRNEAVNLIFKNGERFAPQNFIEPFIFIIKIKKNLPEHGAWIYISYGTSNSPKNEINYRLTYSEMKKFIEGSKHSTENFLEYLGAKGTSFLKTKIIRAFW